MCFFADFSNFGSILGGPGPSKKCPKIEKNENKSLLERIWSALGVPWSLWEGFGSVLGRFWDGFGMVLGRIFQLFGSILHRGVGVFSESIKRSSRTNSD